MSLENRMTVGAVALYDAPNEEPTREEEEAMDDLERRRKASEYEATFARLGKETPLGLNLQLQEVLPAIEKIDPGFNLFIHDAFNRRDFALIGRLLYRARDLYLHELTKAEVGV